MAFKIISRGALDHILSRNLFHFSATWLKIMHVIHSRELNHMDIYLTKSRRALYRWVGWFFLVNTLLSLLIIMSYLRIIPNFDEVIGVTTGSVILAWIFFFASFIVQFAILFFVSCALILIAISIYPRRWLAFALGILFSTVLMFGLIGDSMVYGLYHMHYAGVGWTIFKAGAMSEVLSLSYPERIFLFVMIAVIFIIEYFIAFLVWRRIAKRNTGSIGYRVAGVFAVLLITSYGLMFMATGLRSKRWLQPSDNHVILKAARIVPYYNDIYAMVMPGDSSIRHIQTPEGQVTFQIRQLNKPLNYPLHPLKCIAPKEKLNVLIIGIDTWRYDSMTKTITPHIYEFAQNTLQFQDHWSGGNCTKPGLFSMFYSIPANYWRAVLTQRHTPVLMNQFIKNNYQIRIFTSAPNNFPAFNKTIFLDVKHLLVRTKGTTSVARDRQITKEFDKFLVKRDKNKPFFSFLFYDAAHNYCQPQTPHQKPFGPAVKSCERFSLTPDSPRMPYVNRYHNAVYFVDGEVEKVLDDLKQHHLLKNTIVIITADHGEQLNDQRMNYWDHASAYTPYQLHIPLLVYWPGKKPEKIDYFTTHYDIVPTLMTEVLGCTSPAVAYSVGHSLFQKGDRPFLIAGSYADYAVVTKERITRIYEGGDYTINYPNGHYMISTQLEPGVLRQAYKQLNRYFH